MNYVRTLTGSGDETTKRPVLDPIEVYCIECGKKFSTRDPKKLYCKDACAKLQKGRIHHRRRFCRWCGKRFPVVSPNNNQRSCTTECASAFNAFMLKRWRKAHPDRMDHYLQTLKSGNPTVWREKARQERLLALELLGGKRIVCGVNNSNWLHIDYIPGSEEFEGQRHPRHLAYIRRHLDKFRILCANHHYELTLTGKIEGTDITQVRKTRQWTNRL